MVKCASIMNNSKQQIQVICTDGTAYFLPPKGVLVDLDVENYYSIKKFIVSKVITKRTRGNIREKNK